WDLPIYSLLVLAAFAMRAYTSSGRLDAKLVRKLLLFALILVGLSITFYLPFYLGLKIRTHGLGLVPMRTRFHQYLVMFGLFITIIVGFLAVALRASVQAAHPKAWREAYRSTLISLGLWGVACLLVPWALVRVLGLVGLVLLQPISGGYPTTASFLLVLMLVAAAILGQRLRTMAGRPTERISQRGMSTCFACLLVLAGLALTCGVEFFYIVDVFRSRMNTVFKLYFQAWTFLAIASSYGLYYVFSRWRISPHRPRIWGKLGRGAWLWLVWALFGGSLIYPLAAVYAKADGFRGIPTLDGTHYMEELYPDDHGAIAWVRANTQGDEVLVEAVGPDYSEYARVSTQTGLATLLGWVGHEAQWREGFAEGSPRQEAIEAIYTSGDPPRVKALLEKYGADYLYIGALERAKYGISQEDEAIYRDFL
ncbi:MAG: DUF2298 domain-containing protein, partial [Chloroflexota bacterium]|nr:DUF2298 domain-containing protein [Chloroflexota bacterium]